MGLDYSDVAQAAAALHAVSPRVPPLARAVAKKTGYDTVAGAQVAAPVDTGMLKGSISVDIDGDGLGWTAGPTVEYGGFVEYGTAGPYEIPGAFGRPGSVTHPGISPQPYMGPAFEHQVDVAENALARAAAQLLR